MKKFMCISLIVLFFSCKKEKNKDYCWEVFDRNSGFRLLEPQQCNKSYNDLKPQLGSKFFAKANEPKYCYVVTKNGFGTRYLKDFPEVVIDSLFKPRNFIIEKVNCGQSCIVQWCRVRKSKVTGFFGSTFCTQGPLTNAGDSCSRLYKGRQIVIKDDADSLVYMEVKEIY